MAYAEDIHRNADISSQNHNRALAAAQAAAKSDGAAIGPSLPLGAGASMTIGGGVAGHPGERSRRQVDPVALPMDAQELAELEARRLAATRADGAAGLNGENPTLWCETVSEEGSTYYWNVKTNGMINLFKLSRSLQLKSFLNSRNRLGQTQTRLLDPGRVQ